MWNNSSISNCIRKCFRQSLHVSRGPHYIYERDFCAWNLLQNIKNNFIFLIRTLFFSPINVVEQININQKINYVPFQQTVHVILQLKYDDELLATTPLDYNGSVVLHRTLLYFELCHMIGSKWYSICGTRIHIDLLYNFHWPGYLVKNAINR